jgi:hypothetical protein
MILVAGGTKGGSGKTTIATTLVGYPLGFDRFGPLCETSLHSGT